jgi:hypothetical protein
MPNRFSAEDLRGGMGLEQNSFLASLFPTHTIAERNAMYQKLFHFNTHESAKLVDFSIRAF